jgi:hypothetical protein
MATMKIDRQVLRALLGSAVASFVLAACGDPPRPVEPAAASGPGPVDPHAPLPADHPPIGAGASSQPSAPPATTDPGPSFGGVVRLKGALAERPDGFLFISLVPGQVPEGTPEMPFLSIKLSLALDVPAAANGERAVTFDLNRRTTMMPPTMEPLGELRLVARVDPDGAVDTREPDVLKAYVPATAGRTDHELVLDPGAQ